MTKARMLLIAMTLSTLALASCNSETTQSLTQADPAAPMGQPNPPGIPTTEPVTPIPTGSDLFTGPADLEKYVVKFIDDARAQGLDVVPDLDGPKLELRIASLDAYGSSTIGLCETSSTRRRVTLDPDFWNTVSETQRELLAHHELGHCVLKRGHRTTKLESGAFASIMYPTIMSSSTYNGNYAYYQEELFTYGVSSSLEAEPDQVHICN